MLICFEGVDCSGKSTMVNKVYDYLMAITPTPTINDPIRSIFTVKFPSHTEDSGFHVENVLQDRLINNNPFYTAMGYLTDFYSRINTDKDLIAAIKSDTDVVLFDRYYYSSLVMCSHWAKSSKSNKDSLFAFINDAINKLNLPAPDLNIVLMPRLQIVLDRVAAKKNKDSMEGLELTKKFYSNYSTACSFKAIDIFGSHGEKLPPVIINDTNFIFSFNRDDENVKTMAEYLDPINTKTPDQMTDEVIDVVDALLKFKLATSVKDETTK